MASATSTRSGVHVHAPAGYVGTAEYGDSLVTHSGNAIGSPTRWVQMMGEPGCGEAAMTWCRRGVLSLGFGAGTRMTGTAEFWRHSALTEPVIARASRLRCVCPTTSTAASRAA